MTFKLYNQEMMSMHYMQMQTGILYKGTEQQPTWVFSCVFGGKVSEKQLPEETEGCTCSPQGAYLQTIRF